MKIPMRVTGLRAAAQIIHDENELMAVSISSIHTRHENYDVPPESPTKGKGLIKGLLKQWVSRK